MIEDTIHEDKSSSLMKEQQTDYIKNLISKDEKLPLEDRKMFNKMAMYYADNFTDNLNRTSMDLSKKYQTYTPDQWVEFLNYPAMYKYITKYKNERMKQIADAAMLSGDSNGIKLRAELERTSTTNYSNLIVLRLPDKEDIDDSIC